VMSSCLCKYGEGAGFPLQIESLEDGIDDAVTLSTFTKHTMGRVLLRTSTKQRSITFVVRSLRHRCRERQRRRAVRQIAFQTPHHAAVVWPPAGAEAAKGGFGLPRPSAR